MVPEDILIGALTRPVQPFLKFLKKVFVGEIYANLLEFNV